MKCVVGKDWAASLSCLKTTYQAMVEPCLEYAVPAGAHIVTSNLSKHDKIQNHAAKIMTGATRSTPVKLMEFNTGFIPLQKRRYKIVFQYGARLIGLKATHMNHELISNWQRTFRLKQCKPLNYIKIF